MRWAGYVVGKRNAYKVFMGKPEGKGPLERAKRRWDDNIKMYSKEVGWVGMCGINWAEDRTLC